ncbi:hypothetical protein N9924_01280 [bacterium]|nr:hypothetical protein [bacterium]
MIKAILITKEFIESNKTPGGGWNRKQIEAIGLEWPPRKGWKKSVIGRCISLENAQIFGAHSMPNTKPIKNPLTAKNNRLMVENECLKNQIAYLKAQVEDLEQSIIVTEAKRMQ